MADTTLKLSAVLDDKARAMIVQRATEDTVEHIELWLARKDAEFKHFDDHAWKHLQAQLSGELSSIVDGLEVPATTAEQGTPDG